MSLPSKREYVRQIRGRYHRAGREYKSQSLEEYCQVCGYDRKYAIKRLAVDPQRPRHKPGRPPRYDRQRLLPVLRQVWLASDQMCSKRLRTALPKWLPHLSPLAPTLQEWSAYQNFFCPNMKLISKQRVRSRYRRRYDPPQTPYERSQENKRRLQATYASPNSFALKKTIELKLKIYLLSTGSNILSQSIPNRTLP